MLTGTLANFRWQSVLTSTYGLSCASAIPLAYMAEDNNPLGFGRSPTGDVAGPSSVFTCGSVR